MGPAQRFRKIETNFHDSRVVMLAQHRSRIRTDPGGFFRVRGFGFNILKANKTAAVSQHRYCAARAGIENLLKTPSYHRVEWP